MRVRLPIADKWSADFQRQLNGELERALEKLNEYALVPYGGTDGQVLSKSTDRPYVTTWAAAGAGSSYTFAVGAGLTVTNVANLVTYTGTFATNAETDTGTVTDKIVAPSAGAYAYDRLRHGAQHTAGKGTQRVTLTDGATISTDCTLSNVFKVTLAGNRTFANPTSPYDGQVINVLFKQDATGGRTITWGSKFTWVGSGVPVLTTTANAVDMISCQYDSADDLWRCSFLPGFGYDGTFGILLHDGDKGDITVSASGLTWTIDNSVVTYAKIQNVSATSRILGRKTAAAGVVEECTLSEILDFIGSATWGDVLFRGTAGWQRLAAGTSGHVLQTNGAGADPSWVAQTGGGGTDITNRVTSDFVITSNTTFTDVTGLTVALTAGAYEYEVFVLSLSNAGPDLKSRLHYTGTVTTMAGSNVTVLSSASTCYGSVITAIDTAGTLTTTTTNTQLQKGTIVVSTSGTFSFQAAQGSSSATPVTVYSGSRIRVRPLA